MSSWGLKYYHPLCGFDCGQVLNKRHVRKHGFGKADNLGFKEQGTKDPRTRCWLGYLSSLLSLFLFLYFLGGGFFGAGGGCLSLFQVHLYLSLLRVHFFIPFGHYAKLSDETIEGVAPKHLTLSAMFIFPSVCGWDSF